MTLNRSLPATMAIAVPSKYPIGSSEWWLDRLTRTLSARQERFELLDSYYCGTQDTSRLATQAYREAGLLDLFPNLNANHSKLIVNAAAQRLVVLGFRLAGDIRVDTEAARIWYGNELDALSDVAHTEALVKGECPVLVEPNPADPTLPLITPQSPDTTIVWHAAGDRRIRLAGLKTWWDDTTRKRTYLLYLPDRIERWEDRDAGQMAMWLDRLFSISPARWTKVSVDENPLGEVPLVVLPNDPRLAGSPEGEHEPALTLIDLYNFLLMNMAHTAKELAFPQRWAKGIPRPTEEVDADGEPIAAPEQVRNSPSDMLIADDPAAGFGQFAAAELGGYATALAKVRAEIATVTFTPVYFLLAEPTSVPPSGESRDAAEIPLVDKVRGHGRDKGVSWRMAMYLAFRLIGDEQRARAIRAGKTIWRDPESRSWSSHIDALSKLAADPIGVPQEAVWELIPVPPEEISRWKAMRAEDAANAAAAALTTPPAVVAPDTDAVDDALQELDDEAKGEA